MKKLSVYIILSLVMCLAMVFPAFAVVYNPSLHATLNTTFNTYHTLGKSKAPVDYKYYFTRCSNPSSAPVTLNQVFYFNTETINVGSVFYVAGANNNFYGPFTITSMNYNYTANCFNLISDGNDYNVAGCIINFSTARLSDSLLSAIPSSYDFFLSTLAAVNIKDLQSLINTAKTKKEDVYTSISWQALQSAISDSENLLKTMSYTQSQIDTSKNTLQDALDGLVLLPDTTVFQSLITTAKIEVNAGYTPESWQALQMAISAAENLLKTMNYTQSQIEAANNTLQAALDGLVLLPDLPESVMTIDMFNAVVVDNIKLTIVAILPACLLLFGFVLVFKLIPYLLSKFH